MNQSKQTLVNVFISLLILLGGSLLLSIGLRGCRLDLTQEGLYTLSEGSRTIVEAIDEPIQLDLYWSDAAAKDLPQFQSYAQRVREFLEELVQLSGGKLQLNVLDPEPFSEAEDAASAAGLASLSVDGAGNTLTLGLVGTNAVDETESIAFFDPQKEAFLEYDVARLLQTLSNQAKAKVGVLTSLPVEARFDQQTGRMAPGWQFLAQMRQLFEVEMIAADATSLPADLQVLVLVHPTGLAEEILQAIDQYALDGGNLLAFLDPHCEADPAASPASGPLGGGAQPMLAPSDLGPLLAAWGVDWNAQQFIGDRQYAQRVRSSGSGLGATEFLAWLGLPADALQTDDPVTGTLDQINLATAGSFTSSAGASTTLQPLMQSSTQAAPIATAKMLRLYDPAILQEGFQPSGEKYTLAARLEGELKSAYGEQTGTAGGIFLVADADLLADRNWIVEESMGPIKLGWRSIADNGAFLLNALETLAGSDALLSLRGRGNAQRPFETVNQLRRQAEERYQDRELELQQEIQNSQTRLSELQREKSTDNSMLILSPEQEQELEHIQSQMLDARKELRKVRHSLSRDIEGLGRRLMLLNVVGTPLLAALLMIGWMAFRYSRRKNS
jgi:gliding motility-associatede transport system auxiliary component